MDFLVTEHKMFKNPDKLPLNEVFLKMPKRCLLNIDEGETYPAIHGEFIDGRSFTCYQEYCTELEESDERIEEYRNKTLKFVEDLDFLLKINYQQFWCYLVTYPPTSIILKSYLLYFTPEFKINTLHEGIRDLLELVHMKVQHIFCRIFTFRESPYEFMAPHTVLEQLEKCNLLTFSTFTNLALAFHNTCPRLVDKVHKLFSQNDISKYDALVDHFLDHLWHVLEMLHCYICGFNVDAIIVPIALDPKPTYFDPKWYKEALLHYMEALILLAAMLKHSIPMTEKTIKIGIPNRIISFYNEVFPYVYKIMSYLRSEENDYASTRRCIYDIIARARKESIACLNIIITNLIQCVSKAKTSDEKVACVEDFLAIMGAALEGDLFIFDYHCTHNMGEQTRQIVNIYPELDSMHTKYIHECLEALPALDRIYQRKEAAEVARAQHELSNVTLSSNTNAREFVEPVDNGFSEDEINIRIQIVEETIPDLGDAFILACLQECNFDPVAAITLLLDGNLPPFLSEIPRNAIRVPEDTPPKPAMPILAYRGKKPGAIDADTILNEKSDRELKDIILQSVHEDLYDDDYDDRDEHQTITAPYNRSASSSEEEEESNPPSGYTRQHESLHMNKKRDGFRPFCEDPAKLREQREMARRNFHGRGSGGNSRDVIGGAKGQGQNEQVLRNRNKKTANKATSGNHNRKKGALWKASRGMF